MTGKKLDLRTEPKQLRALDRVEAILAVTESMVANGEKVTTSSIAKKAGIPVGSIYRYFPDINAIYSQLFKIINNDMMDKVKLEIQNVDPEISWQERLQTCMKIMSQTYESKPAFGDLLLMMESPELRDSKNEITSGVTNALATRWRNGLDGFSGTDPDIVARTVIEMATANELCYFLEKDQSVRDRLYLEWSIAMAAYLNIYLKA